MRRTSKPWKNSQKLKLNRKEKAAVRPRLFFVSAVSVLLQAEIELIQKAIQAYQALKACNYRNGATVKKARLVGTGLMLSLALAFAAQAQGGPPKWAVGGMGLYRTTPFQAEDSEFNAFPYLAYRGDRFFIQGRQLGVHIRQADDASDLDVFLDVVASPRMLPGSSRNKVTADAGVRFGLDGTFGTLSLEALHDITGTSNGTELKLGYSYGFTSGKLRLTPRFGMVWQDKDLANYLWGTTLKQQSRMLDKGRNVILPVFQPDKAALNFEAGLMAVYDLTDTLSLVAFSSATYLDKDIRANPGIDKKYQVTTGLGIAYNF